MPIRFLTSVYFEGNAPSLSGVPFLSAPFITVFRHSGATGWELTYGDRPTTIWTARPS